MRLMMGLLVLVLASCADEPVSAPGPFESAQRRSRGAGRLLLVDFTLPGRAVSDEMTRDTLDAPAVLARVARHFERCRLDARADIARFERLVGSGPGLASCVLGGDGLVVAMRRGFATPQAYLRFLERGRRLAPMVARAHRAVAARGRPEDRLQLGAAWMDGGCHDRARRALVRAAESGDGTTVARAAERLARLSIECGHVGRARRWLTRYAAVVIGEAGGRANASAAVLKIAQHGAELTRGLVWIAERRMTDAARHLTAVRERSPEHPEMDRLLFHLAEARHESGADARALRILAELTRRYPESTWAAQAREQVNHIRAADHGHKH